MSRITINSNIASLNAQRRLSQSSHALGTSFERLSSGLRINRAKDDAAGLAIASALNVDRRIFNQGVRNLSDGASLLNIAEGSLEELSNIVIRLRELAEQSANGTLASPQRKALDAEAQALSREFSRIAQSTQYNGRLLFDGQLTNVRLQGGYGADGGIVSTIGGKIGDATFGALQSVGTSTSHRGIALGDVNADGTIDIFSSTQTGVRLHLGNGDGTFRLGVTFATGGSPYGAQLSDFNGDGRLDLVNTDGATARAFILIGNGDGTFRAATSFATATATFEAAAEDFNGDGIIDIAAAQQGGGGPISVLLGNGDGTFRVAVTYFGDGTLTSIRAKDLNGDGAVDLAVGDLVGGKISILLGNGDGTFKARVSNFAAGSPREMQIADYNGDGVLDIAVTDTSDQTFRIALGNGNGTFRAAQSYGAGFYSNVLSSGDYNGDGIQDLAVADFVSAGTRVHLGNGNGTFRLGMSFASGGSTEVLVSADFDGDGVLDFFNGTGSGELRLGNSTAGVAPLLPFSLRYSFEALQALSVLEDAQTRINLQRATIGAFQSRIATGVSALQQNVENVATAESRILDIDVAEEAALLTKSRILQQSGAAILAQANRTSELALRLLNIDGG